MTGLPVIAFILADMLMLFLPICLIKAIVYQKELGVPQKESFVGAGLANSISSFIGSILVYIPYLIFSLAGNYLLIEKLSGFFANESVPMQIIRGIFGGILLSGSTGPTVGVACFILILLSFFMSVWIESKVLSKFFKMQDSGHLIIAVKKGNLYSFPLLLVGIFLIVIFGL